MSSKPDDEDSQRTQPELPSVIVDPALLGAGSGPVALASESFAPTPSPASSPADGPSSTSALEDHLRKIASDTPDLSIQDADRYAASIRPSWEPPVPASPARAAITRGDSRDANAVAIENDPLPAVSLAGRMSPVRAASLAALIILGFGGLVVLAMTGGETERPESWHAGTHPADEPNPPTGPSATAASARTLPPAPAVTAQVPGVAAVATNTPTSEASGAPVGNMLPTSPAVPAETTPAPAEPVPDPPTAPTASPQQPTPEPAVSEPERVRMRVATAPRSASLRLDGKPVGNPLDAMLPRGGEHRVEAQAPGYAARAVTLTLDQNRAITIELERARGRVAAPAPAPKRRSSPAAKKAPGSKSAGFVSDSPY